jgi:hypothetical protein
MAEQDAVKLVGLYLGRSKEPAKLRLYLTRNFTRYLEFLKEDTLHSERTTTGGVVAWLAPGAPFAAMTVPATGPEDFLQGGLLDNLGEASEAETIRRLLGLGKGACGDPPKPQETALGGSSCPDPNTCTTPGKCHIEASDVDR